MKNMEIDCIKLKREIQEQIYEEIKDMTSTEQLAWFRAAEDADTELARKYRGLRSTHSRSTSTPASEKPS